MLKIRTQAIMIIVVCIIILSCILYAITQTTEVETQTTPQPANCEPPKEQIIKTGCDLLNDTGQRDVCLKDEPYEKWDCTKFTDYLFVIQCYQKLAIHYKNPQYCIHLHTDYDRDNCYMGVANEINNPAICMGIIFPNIREHCYKKINLEGISPDVCNSGWTLDERHECRELIMEANK